ncbi:MAG: DUF2961 domain-containing protein [Paludibaculum sp.]
MPNDALYFHAQYRQATPNVRRSDLPKKHESRRRRTLLLRGARTWASDGRDGGGELNKEAWMGEGDEMIFVDDETKPLIRCCSDSIVFPY